MNAQQEADRNRIITRTSVTGIVVNAVLAAVKLVVGWFTGSLSISADAVNNLSDTASSVITIVGTKLAAKRPTKEHPFGFGRIEYLTSIVISVIILVTGANMLIDSVKAIITPSEVSYGLWSILILAATVVVKMLLGTYTQKKGEEAGSDSLKASGTDARNDSLISLITIFSAVIFMLTGYSIDGIAGAAISCFVLKTGFDILTSTLSKLLGEKGDKEAAAKIRGIVSSTPGILGAHDLILHNYGPGRNTGSINVEIDSKTKLTDVYKLLHGLQVKLYRECGCYMVFGIYSVNKNSPRYRRLSRLLGEFTASTGHCSGFHGLYIDEKDKYIYCDFVVDYDTDRREFTEKAENFLRENYPEFTPIVTIDTVFA
ncbi:MAG: cation diffusion facilitator family transporter [Oscillospiraceae bacterium]|jgi:cation diffusion facilitator family transporter